MFLFSPSSQTPCMPQQEGLNMKEAFLITVDKSTPLIVLGDEFFLRGISIGCVET